MASQITVTANLIDPSGTALTGNAFVRFKLRNFQGFVPVVSGTSVICETQIDALPTAGAVSQALWGNNNITPATTFYTVEFWDQGRITSSGNYLFSANTSLNTAAQLNAPPVPAGFKLVLENNGTLNSSQSTLNIESTDASVTITDAGSGNINLQAGTLSLPWFVGPGLTTNIGAIISASMSPVTVSNVVQVFEFFLPGSITVKNAAVSFTNAGAHVLAFGIYSIAGNLLLDSRAMSGASAAVVTSTITPVVLQAGNYYFAQTGNSAVPTVQGLSAQAQNFLNMMNINAPRAASAANAYNGTNLPITLGVLTALTVGNYGGVAYPIFF